MALSPLLAASKPSSGVQTAGGLLSKRIPLKPAVAPVTTKQLPTTMAPKPAPQPPATGNVPGHVAAGNTSAAAGAAGSAYNPDGSVKPGREAEVGKSYPLAGPGVRAGIQDGVLVDTSKSTRPGVTQGVPQTQFEGIDMTQYGPLEDLWRDQGAKFFDETNSQQWWNMVAPGLTGSGQGSTWNQQNAGAYQTPGFGETTNQDISNSLQGPSTTAGYWDENGQFVQTPGMGENYAGGALGKYANGTPGVTNRADEAFQQFLGARPNIDMDAGLEEYYDFAKKRGGESLNRELAARGVYGSGRGLDKLGDMYSGLEAELANRKADYYLRALAEDRGWAGLGLQGASSADVSSARQSQNELDWTRGLGDLAFQGQNAGMNRWMAGLTGSQAADATNLARAGMRAGTATNAQNMGFDRLNQGGDFAFRSGDEDLRRATGGANIAGLADSGELASLSQGFGAAGNTQAAERARGQDYFNNTFATSGAFADMFGDAYGDVINNDQSLMDSWMSALLGYDTENLNRDDRRQAQDAAEKAARDAAIRNAVYGGATALAPTTGGWSLAAIPAYEGIRYLTQ